MEKDLWKKTRKGLKKISTEIDLCRVENILEDGMPDVNYCIEGSEGWIENKFKHKWPVREDTPVRVGMMPGQIPWLINRTQCGGRAFLFVQIGTSFLLFRGDRSILRMGELTKAEMYTRCLYHWEDKINFIKLKELLCN